MEEEAVRKNISLQILQNEEEPDETSNELLQEFNDFQYKTENSFDFLKKDNKTQITIDQFFTPYSVSSKNNDMNPKLEELELENHVLKIELKELKDKFSHLEYLVYNRLTGAPCGDSVNSSSIIPHTLYDRLQTKIKELESDVKKIKEEIEILDSNHCQLGEHVELIQLEIDKINEEFGMEDEGDV
jgi:hypothetical protein